MSTANRRIWRLAATILSAMRAARYALLLECRRKKNERSALDLAKIFYLIATQ